MSKSKKRGLLVALTFLFLTLGLATWYSSRPQVPSEVKELYSSYLDTIMFDYDKAANAYCHFEMPIIKELIEQSDDFVTSYKILNWEKINDDLWAVQTSFRTLSIPDGDIMFNFVGNIDGKYYVMINAYQVPVLLHKNFNPIQYIPSNAVPYQDDVGLLG